MIEDGEVRPKGCICEIGSGMPLLCEIAVLIRWE